MSHYHWGEFQTHAFHVVPSMGPIVSVINLQTSISGTYVYPALIVAGGLLLHVTLGGSIQMKTSEKQ